MSVVAPSVQTPPITPVAAWLSSQGLPNAVVEVVNGLIAEYLTVDAQTRTVTAAVPLSRLAQEIAEATGLTVQQIVNSEMSRAVILWRSAGWRLRTDGGFIYFTGGD